jgi:hypothetical protein
MDSLASNYNPDAIIEGYCVYLGCTDSSADNYDPDANEDNNNCEYLGCIDQDAFNYNADANKDDGSCYPIINGCTDPLAYNYVAPTGNVQIDINTSSPDMCDYLGCTYVYMFNYDSLATIDDGSCYPVNEGCTDSTAYNYDAPTGDVQVDVNTDNGSCYEVVLGCLDPLADNYNDFDLDSLSNNLTGENGKDVNTNDNDLCIYFGCINELAFNFDSTANTNDNTCYTVIVGCLD